jgi:hypothetical protein
LGGGSLTPSASPPWTFIFLIFLFLSTLLTEMTGITMPIQWPLTLQSHGSFRKENKWFFCYGSNSISGDCVFAFISEWPDEFVKKPTKRSQVLAQFSCTVEKVA